MSTPRRHLDILRGVVSWGIPPVTDEQLAADLDALLEAASVLGQNTATYQEKQGLTDEQWQEAVRAAAVRHGQEALDLTPEPAYVWLDLDWIETAWAALRVAGDRLETFARVEGQARAIENDRREDLEAR